MTLGRRIVLDDSEITSPEVRAVAQVPLKAPGIPIAGANYTFRFQVRQKVFYKYDIEKRPRIIKARISHSDCEPHYEISIPNSTLTQDRWQSELEPYIDWKFSVDEKVIYFGEEYFVLERIPTPSDESYAPPRYRIQRTLLSAPIDVSQASLSAWSLPGTEDAGFQFKVGENVCFAHEKGARVTYRIAERYSGSYTMPPIYRLHGPDGQKITVSERALESSSGWSKPSWANAYTKPKLDEPNDDTAGYGFSNLFKEVTDLSQMAVNGDIRCVCGRSEFNTDVVNRFIYCTTCGKRKSFDQVFEELRAR